MPNLSIVDSWGDSTEDWIDELVSENPSKGKQLNKTFKLFLVYKYIKKGKAKDIVTSDKRWDGLNIGKNSRACKKILEAYEGDLKQAARAVYEIGSYFESEGFIKTWNCNTVLSHITDWEEGRLVERNR